MPGLNSPPVVLLRSGTNELCVGLADPDPGAASLGVEGVAAAVGAPSLDAGLVPNVLHVGGEGGVLHTAVVPF